MNSFRPRFRILAAVVAVGLLSAACGSSGSGGDVASIGDLSLSRDLLDELVDGSAEGTVTKAGATDAITSWVRNELWYAELADRGYEIDPSFLEAARAELEIIAANNPDVPDLDSAFGAQVIRGQALPAVVADYLLNTEDIEIDWPAQLCSSHILLETEEEALAAIERLDAGEDFAALAVELSTGPSGPSGGALGCVDPSSFVPEFIEGASAVTPPGVTDPVETQFGWHVIEVQSFDSTVPDDPAAIQNAVFARDEFLELRDLALAREVSIDAEFGTWDGAASAVIPAG